MPKKTDRRLELAKEFMTLLTPRIMEGFTAELDSNIENMRAVKALAIKDADTKTAEKLLVELEAKMQKLLSGVPAQKVEQFYAEQLAEMFTEEQFEMLILIERFNIGFAGLSAQATAVLEEALGEV